jgi:L-asparaginase II
VVILVELVRGSAVEGRHYGAAAVVDAAGALIHAVGDIERLVFPRSAIKPVQALPLIETGAADRAEVSIDELALSLASHRGEPAHTDRISAWLGRIGLSEGVLECGAHEPSDEIAQNWLIRNGQRPSQLHNNCSGQHTGFLCTARSLGEATRLYVAPDHPVQRRVTRAIGDITGLDLARAPIGVDGCGIPTFAIPLRALALAMARMADPSHLADGRRDAVRRLTRAMAIAPILVDGSAGMATAVMIATNGSVLMKPGAEGVLCAIVPGHGFGVAVKIADGAKRAADLAMMTLLARLGCFTSAQEAALEPYLKPKVLNVVGMRVGELRPTAALTN